MKAEIRDSAGIKPDTLNKLPSPYERLVSSIKEEGEYYTYPEVVQMLGVSQPTLRKAISDTGAPSKYVAWGKRHVWLFTHNDVEVAADILGTSVKWH